MKRSFLLLLLAACSPDTPPKQVTVEMRGFAFQPAELRVQPGDTVVFVNRDVVPHTATAAGTFDSGIIAADSSASIVVSGTTEYVCALHPAMKGLLRVD